MKAPAKAESPLTESGIFRHQDGRSVKAGRWPSGNWSVVFDDGSRWPFTTDEEFRRSFTPVEVTT